MPLEAAKTDCYDLIRREDAYDALTLYYHHKTETQHAALKESLDRVPSAVKRGKWEMLMITTNPSKVRYICSVCRAPFDEDKNDLHRFAYCPECGARMEE